MRFLIVAVDFQSCREHSMQMLPCNINAVSCTFQTVAVTPVGHRTNQTDVQHAIRCCIDLNFICSGFASFVGLLVAIQKFCLCRHA